MAPLNVKKHPKKKKVEAKFKLRKPLTKVEANFKVPLKRHLLSSALVNDNEPEFPRGGGSLLSLEEKAEARAEAEAEFEVDHGLKRKGGEIKKNMKRKMVRGKCLLAVEDEWWSLFGQGIAGKLPNLTNNITWKNISPGMKLWGLIVEVNLKDIEVSLPGGLRGFVHAEDVSDVLQEDGNKMPHSIPKTVNVGQLVSCVVINVDEDKGDEKVRKRIKLSMRLSVLYKGLTLDAVPDGMVLIAEVRSAEDHGYILHFGVPSFSGFLSKCDSGNIQIYKGQLLHCVVKSVDKVRAVVYAISSADLVSKYVTKDLKGLSIDILVPGMMVNAYVHSKLENGIMLSFLTYFTGTVDIFNLQYSFPTDNLKDEYAPHKKVNARILFIDPSTRAVGLTLNPHLVLQHTPPPMHAKPGEIYEKARVLRIDQRFGLLLSITSSLEHTLAYVHRIDASDEEVLKLKKKFKEGDYVRLCVQGIRKLEGVVIGTLKASAFDQIVFTHLDVKPGFLAKAQVITVGPFGAIVQFASGVKALCPCRHMSEFKRVKPAKKFKVGAELLFRVLGSKSKRITVTHKKTLIKSNLAILASYADATEGLLTHGWITKIEKHGCYVRFYNGVQGFAPRSELGLDPGSEPNTGYHVEQVVKCRITRSGSISRIISISFVIFPKRVPTVNLSSKRVDITLKEKNESRLPKPDASSFSNLHVGGIVSGHVRRVETFGLFIEIDGTSLVGLCHISEISNDNISHIETKYRAGERVVAKVLKIDEERQRICLGMKHSYIIGVDNAAMGGMSSAKQEDLLCIKYINDEEDDSASAILSQAESRAFVLPLQVSLDDFENSKMESDINENQSDTKKTMNVDNRRDRRMTKKEKQERELAIHESEERRLQNDTPKTVDDFEKLVRCSPNSSFFWIKYMEFILSLADVEKARSIAERAIKTVTFQEEGERLNIWVAYLNLENAYGNSPEEDVERVFKAAAQTCDPKKLHLALLALYQRTEQHTQADALLDKMTKKFKKSCKVWLSRVQYFLNHKEDGVQSVINCALLSLPTNKHIKFISHTAILEFKCGMAEMGRPLFEGILREHPKRTDIWSVYLDQEIRLGDNEVIRSLFERATCLSLPAKKMKFLFKKYHFYEESLGNKDRMEYVKCKALQYLKSSN